MNRYTPVAALALLILSEAFLKAYLPIRYPILITLFPFLLLLFLLTLFAFLYFSKKSSVSSSVWEDQIAQEAKTNWPFVWLVFGAAFLFRFWKLETLFAGIFWDEAYKGLDAIAIREFHERPIFLDWNAGREALVAYLVAFSQSLFGYTTFAVRAVQAFAGWLAVVFFYFFVKRIFDHRLALLSAFLLAVSKWHIIHSRSGIRVALIVLFELASLYLLARAMQSEKKNSPAFLLAGVVTGLGFYTYIAYRIFPLVLIAFVLDSSRLAVLRKNIKAILAGILLFLIVIAPLAHFYIKNRTSFTDRMSRTAVWKTRGTDAGPARLIYDATTATLKMFTYRGDPIARHNIEEEPMLSPFSTAFFILGAGITLFNIRKRYSIFLWTYFFLTVLPGFLSVNAPHSSRTLGSLPASMLFTAIGLLAAFRTLEIRSPAVARIFMMVALAGNLYTGPNDALLRYAKIIESLPARISSVWGMDEQQEHIARLLNRLGPRCDVFLTPQYFFHASVEYLTYSKSSKKLLSPASLPKVVGRDKVAVIVLQQEPTNMWWLRDDDGKNFFKWWRQRYGMPVKEIRAIVRRAYVSYPRMTRMNDRRFLRELQRLHPQGRTLNLREYTVFLAKRP